MKWRGEGQNIPSFSSMFHCHKTHLVLLGQDLEIHTHGLLTLSPRTHPSPGQMASLWPLGMAVDVQEIRPQTSTHFMKPEAKHEGGPARDCSLHSGTRLKCQRNCHLDKLCKPFIHVTIAVRCKTLLTFPDFLTRYHIWFSHCSVRGVSFPFLKEGTEA